MHIKKSALSAPLRRKLDALKFLLNSIEEIIHPRMPIGAITLPTENLQIESFHRNFVILAHCDKTHVGIAFQLGSRRSAPG